MALDEELGMNFYDILGVNKDSSNAEIRSAYRKLARKWHPDKWSKDPFSTEEAKSRFQQIQEAYSVLSDDTKRAMYDAGVYEAGDDVDGFTDFLDEMATMADVKTQSNKEDSFEELQEMFMKMVNENWFSTVGIQHSSEPPMDKEMAAQKQYPFCEMSDFWKEEGEDDLFDDGDDYEYPFCEMSDFWKEEGEDDWFDDDDDYDYNEDNLCSAPIQDHQRLEQEEQGIRYKKRRVCTNEGSTLKSIPVGH